MAKKVKRPAESWTYTLRSDRKLDAAEQSRFVLSPLSQDERARVRDEIARVHTNTDGTRSIISKSRQQGLEIVLGHIVSIENFPAGEPEKWPAETDARRKYLEQLDDEWIQEIANEIWDKSAIGADVKNS